MDLENRLFIRNSPVPNLHNRNQFDSNGNRPRETWGCYSHWARFLLLCPTAATKPERIDQNERLKVWGVLCESFTWPSVQHDLHVSGESLHWTQPQQRAHADQWQSRQRYRAVPRHPHSKRAEKKQKEQQGYKITLSCIPFSCVSLMLRSLRPASSCISRTSADCFLKQRSLSSSCCWCLCISRRKPVFIVWLSIRGRPCCAAHCLAPSPTRKLGWTTEIMRFSFLCPA